MPGDAPEAEVLREVEGPVAITILTAIPAVVHPEEGGGYWAEVPAFPGCFTQAATLEEIQDNLREVAEGWILAKHDLESAGGRDSS